MIEEILHFVQDDTVAFLCFGGMKLNLSWRRFGDCHYAWGTKKIVWGLRMTSLYLLIY